MCLDKRSRNDVDSVDGALHSQTPAARLTQKPAPISGSAARLPEQTELPLPTRGHFLTAHGQTDPCIAYQKGSHCFCPFLSSFFSVLTAVLINKKTAQLQSHRISFRCCRHLCRQVTTRSCANAAGLEAPQQTCWQPLAGVGSG